MDIKDRIKLASNCLDEAKKQFDLGNYLSVRASLANAYAQNRALLEDIQKLIQLEQGTEHPAWEKVL